MSLTILELDGMDLIGFYDDAGVLVDQGRTGDFSAEDVLLIAGVDFLYERIDGDVSAKLPNDIGETMVDRLTCIDL